MVTCMLCAVTRGGIELRLCACCATSPSSMYLCWSRCRIPSPATFASAAPTTSSASTAQSAVRAPDQVAMFQRPARRAGGLLAYSKAPSRRSGLWAALVVRAA